MFIQQRKIVQTNAFTTSTVTVLDIKGCAGQAGMRENQNGKFPSCHLIPLWRYGFCGNGARTCHDVTRHRDVDLPGFASKNAPLMARSVSTCLWLNERLARGDLQLHYASAAENAILKTYEVHLGSSIVMVRKI